MFTPLSEWFISQVIMRVSRHSLVRGGSNRHTSWGKPASIYILLHFSPSDCWLDKLHPIISSDVPSPVYHSWALAGWQVQHKHGDWCHGRRGFGLFRTTGPALFPWVKFATDINKWQMDANGEFWWIFVGFWRFKNISETPKWVIGWGLNKEFLLAMYLIRSDKKWTGKMLASQLLMESSMHKAIQRNRFNHKANAKLPELPELHSRVTGRGAAYFMHDEMMSRNTFTADLWTQFGFLWN